MGAALRIWTPASEAGRNAGSSVEMQVGFPDLELLIRLNVGILDEKDGGSRISITRLVRSVVRSSGDCSLWGEKGKKGRAGC